MKFFIKKNNWVYQFLGVLLFILLALGSVEDDFTAEAEDSRTVKSYGVITGNAQGENIVVKAEGGKAVIEDGCYEIKIPLKRGTNIITVTYKSKDKEETKKVGIYRLTKKEKKQLEKEQEFQEKIDEVYNSIRILDKKTGYEMNWHYYDTRLYMKPCNNKEILFKVLEEFYVVNIGSKYSKILVFVHSTNNWEGDTMGWFCRISKLPDNKFITIDVVVGGNFTSGKLYSKKVDI